jgi:alpha-ketoglutarate-dependent sulfate ester dioxygenase
MEIGMSTDTSISSAIEVKRVAGCIGADISGVDLSRPLDEITLGEIRTALLTHKVVFFRGQHLGHAEHVALGRQFGELTRRRGNKHGGYPDGFPQILTVDPDSDDERYGRDFERRYRQKWLTYDSGWHTDLAPAVNPPAISILRAQVTPAFGGDTQWTNLVAAYEGLSEPLQRLAEGLRAEHAFFAGCQMLQSDSEDVNVMRTHAEDTLISVHPVVRVHPETGEKALFVQPASASRIIGFTPVESRRVLELFFDQITRVEYTVRFRWEPGHVALWDNRVTAHLAATDLDHTDYHRLLFRVTVHGDRPVGPDGFVSESICGVPLVPFTE